MNQSETDHHESLSPQAPVVTRSFLRRSWAWLGFVALVAAAISAQSRDMLNDRSISNLTTTISLLLAGLLLLVIIYDSLKKITSKRLSLILVLVILLLPVLLIRFRGFSGAMIPMLEFRFRQSASVQETIAKPVESVERASTSFVQFLGENRNAVISTRQFTIPSGDEEEMWRIGVGQGWASFAIDGQYCITTEQRDERECVTCYRLSDGALLWIQEDTARHQNPLGGVGPRSTPTIVADLVYTQGATGIVQCLKKATGEIVWKQHLLELAGWEQGAAESSIAWGRAASPLVVDQVCIVPFGRPLESEPSDTRLTGRSLIAFDRETGEVKWTSGEDQISYASPVLMTLDGETQIVAVNESTVTGHRIEDGSQLWVLDWPGASNSSANCSSAIPVSDNSFLIAKGYGVGSGVYSVSKMDDIWTVEEKWASHRVLKTKFTHACVAGDVAFALSDGMLECVSLIDGKRLWAQPRESRYEHGQMILVEDCLVVQAETGHVAFVAASPDEYKELATIPALSRKTWNVPSIAGDYLAVRNDTEAVMYRLPTKN
jgi:outer membrane protein assembly factor BamB